MYRIRKTKSFDKSFRRIKRSGLKESVSNEIGFVIDVIASGRILAERYHDHNLTGEYAGYCECHIKPDLLLIYKIEKDNLILVLVDIGSHSQLFG